MKAELISSNGTWREVADACNTTIGKEAGSKEPSSSWKRRMLLCEHSPIRTLCFNILWREIKSWVSVHIVRHFIGIVHFVTTQRSDRTGVSRDKLPQDSIVSHRINVNAQAVINISRKRLCRQASDDAREAWYEALQTIRHSEPELYDACVPNCIYRGWCYEFKTCNFHKSELFKQWLDEYRKGINE